MPFQQIKCGPAINKSEEIAFDAIQKACNRRSDEAWYSLTNVIPHQQTYEIDALLLGTRGVLVIEVKHWSEDFLDSDKTVVEAETSKLLQKCKRLASLFKKNGLDFGFLKPHFLLTKTPYVKSACNTNPSVYIWGLKQCQEMLNSAESARYDDSVIKKALSACSQSSAIRITGRLRSICSLKNLELVCESPDRFIREFKGQHTEHNSKASVYVYDLSRRDHANADAIARRACDTMVYLQKLHCVPRVLDTFQAIPGYEGELVFFSQEALEGTSIEQRQREDSWSLADRIGYAASALESLDQIHQCDERGFVHRNITPKTLLVGANGNAIFTGFDLTKNRSAYTVSPGERNLQHEYWTPPEVAANGLHVADQRADVYSLSQILLASLDGCSGEQKELAAAILEYGAKKSAADRYTCKELLAELKQIPDASEAQEQNVSPEHLDCGDTLSFNGRVFTIDGVLGSGSYGRVFRVLELHEGSIGHFAAKIVYRYEDACAVCDAYRRFRPTSVADHLQTVFEISHQPMANGVVALLEHVDGRSLYQLIGDFDQFSQQAGSAPYGIAIRWIREGLLALTAVHRAGFVHGDVSPSNILVARVDQNDYFSSEPERLVLIDIDTIWPAEAEAPRPRASAYSPIAGGTGQSDDVYALALTFFHVIYGKEPFLRDGIYDQTNGVVWDEDDRSKFPVLEEFIKRATDLNPAFRFPDASAALEWLEMRLPGQSGTEEDNSKSSADDECLNDIDEGLETNDQVSDLEWNLNAIAGSFLEGLNEANFELIEQRLENLGFEVSDAEQHLKDLAFDAALMIIRKLKKELGSKPGRRRPSVHSPDYWNPPKRIESTSNPEADTNLTVSEHNENGFQVGEDISDSGQPVPIAESQSDVEPAVNAFENESPSSFDSNETNCPTINSDSQICGLDAREIIPMINFFALAHWAKVEDYFRPKDRKFLFNVGNAVQFRWTLSDAQVNYAFNLLNEAAELGWEIEFR
jgi:serine/threonine protein kinase